MKFTELSEENKNNVKEFFRFLKDNKVYKEFLFAFNDDSTRNSGHDVLQFLNEHYRDDFIYSAFSWESYTYFGNRSISWWELYVMWNYEKCEE